MGRRTYAKPDCIEKYVIENFLADNVCFDWLCSTSYCINTSHYIQCKIWNALRITHYVDKMVVKSYTKLKLLKATSYTNDAINFFFQIHMRKSDQKQLKKNQNFHLIYYKNPR